MRSSQNLDRLGPGSPRVLVPIPLCRRHLGKERLHLSGVIEEPAVQVARIPVDQNASEIEDDGIQARHIAHPTTLALQSALLAPSRCRTVALQSGVDGGV